MRYGLLIFIYFFDNFIYESVKFKVNYSSIQHVDLEKTFTTDMNEI